MYTRQPVMLLLALCQAIIVHYKKMEVYEENHQHSICQVYASFDDITRLVQGTASRFQTSKLNHKEHQDKMVFKHFHRNQAKG